MQSTIEKLKWETMLKVYLTWIVFFLLMLVMQTFQNFFECAYFLPSGAFSTSFLCLKHFHYSVDLTLQTWTEHHVHKETSPRSSPVLCAHLFFFFNTIIQWQYCNVRFISGEYSTLGFFLVAENRALEMSKINGQCFSSSPVLAEC